MVGWIYLNHNRFYVAGYCEHYDEGSRQGMYVLTSRSSSSMFRRNYEEKRNILIQKMYHKYSKTYIPVSLASRPTSYPYYMHYIATAFWWILLV